MAAATATAIVALAGPGLAAAGQLRHDALEGGVDATLRLASRSHRGDGTGRLRPSGGAAAAGRWARTEPADGTGWPGRACRQ